MIARITPLHVEWNNWNGFIFELMGVQRDDFQRSLLGIYGSKEWIMIEIFYIKVLYKERYHFTPNC